jgi:hypothetical protein
MIKIICFRDNLRVSALEHCYRFPFVLAGEDYAECFAWDYCCTYYADFCDFLKEVTAHNNYGNMIVSCPEAMSSNNEVARLADEIVIHYWDNEATVVIVTSSPTFVNRIGRRVYEHNELMDTIEVLSISKDDEVKPGSFEPKHHTFDKKGKLLGWSRGFFDPDDDGPIELLDMSTLRVEAERKENQKFLFDLLDGSIVDYKTLEEVKNDKQNVIDYLLGITKGAFLCCDKDKEKKARKALTFVRQL